MTSLKLVTDTRLRLLILTLTPTTTLYVLCGLQEGVRLYLP